ncbi:hypothetical protein ACRALDRAFT_211764 [Sodiomyces alcalophilus JCM 7366]|uniref:uncharacterized protein n=1 Tax=Sodiomyces alcalophilus JCM 7366 TaxID=591952 RepID=UPI0039B4E9AF
MPDVEGGSSGWLAVCTCPWSHNHTGLGPLMSRDIRGEAALSGLATHVKTSRPLTLLLDSGRDGPNSLASFRVMFWRTPLSVFTPQPPQPERQRSNVMQRLPAEKLLQSKNPFPEPERPMEASERFRSLSPETERLRVNFAWSISARPFAYNECNAPVLGPTSLGTMLGVHARRQNCLLDMYFSTPGTNLRIAYGKQFKIRLVLGNFVPTQAPHPSCRQKPLSLLNQESIFWMSLIVGHHGLYHHSPRYGLPIAAISPPTTGLAVPFSGDSEEPRFEAGVGVAERAVFKRKEHGALSNQGQLLTPPEGQGFRQATCHVRCTITAPEQHIWTRFSTYTFPFGAKVQGSGFMVAGRPRCLPGLKDEILILRKLFEMTRPGSAACLVTSHFSTDLFHGQWVAVLAGCHDFRRAIPKMAFSDEERSILGSGGHPEYHCCVWPISLWAHRQGASPYREMSRSKTVNECVRTLRHERKQGGPLVAVPVFRPPLKEYEDTPKHHARTAAVIAAAVIAATACRVTRLKVKTHN